VTASARFERRTVAVRTRVSSSILAVIVVVVTVVSAKDARPCDRIVPPPSEPIEVAEAPRGGAFWISDTRWPIENIVDDNGVVSLVPEGGGEPLLAPVVWRSARYVVVRVPEEAEPLARFEIVPSDFSETIPLRVTDGAPVVESPLPEVVLDVVSTETIHSGPPEIGGSCIPRPGPYTARESTKITVGARDENGRAPSEVAVDVFFAGEGFDGDSGVVVDEPERSTVRVEQTRRSDGLGILPYERSGAVHIETVGDDAVRSLGVRFVDVATGARSEIAWLDLTFPEGRDVPMCTCIDATPRPPFVAWAVFGLATCLVARRRGRLSPSRRCTPRHPAEA